MEMTDPLAQYRQDAVNTATAEQLVLMLYREALAQVELCRERLPESPRQGLQLTEQARNIFAALADNVNVGHSFGPAMRDLYLYCWRTLLTVATSGDVEGLDPVERVLKNLIAGLEQYRQRQAAASTAADQDAAREPMSVNFAG
jgi:flagellar protein FliS